MARYRIVCVTKQGLGQHDHVETVGIETSSIRWTASQVRHALDDGHGFFTMGSTGEVAQVVPLECPCGARTIGAVATDGVDFAFEGLSICPLRPGDPVPSEWDTGELVASLRA